MAPSNTAAWIKSKSEHPFVVEPAPYNAPGPDEILIRAAAVAINPADNAIQDKGILIEKFPAILGCDAAGTVVEVGQGVTAFKAGDRVTGQTSPLSADGETKYAGFQEYIVMKLPAVAKIPETLGFADAVVLPLGLNTAAASLYDDEQGLDLALPPSTTGKGKTILVWGASSSVGTCAVQLAVASGYEVYGVASTHNHDMIKSLGASQTFDQKSPSIIKDLVNALDGKDFSGAVDAIGWEESLKPLVQVLEGIKAGRKRIVSVQPTAPAFTTENVGIVIGWSIKAYEEGNLGDALWRRFLPTALASGSFKCKPDARIAGHGLAAVQKACDILKAGVSAQKIVVTL